MAKAKPVTFIVKEPPCEKLVEMWCEFLATRIAKQKLKTDVYGKARKRAPGEGYLVDHCTENVRDECSQPAN